MVGYSRYCSDKIVYFEDWVEEDIITQYADGTIIEQKIKGHIDELKTEHDVEDYGDSQNENPTFYCATLN